MSLLTSASRMQGIRKVETCHVMVLLCGSDQKGSLASKHESHCKFEHNHEVVWGQGKEGRQTEDVSDRKDYSR